MNSTSSPSLARRILHETTRFAAIQAFASVLAWAANIALARLLERRDFGVYGICSFYIGVGALLGDGGLGATLMRRKKSVSLQAYRVTLTFLLFVAVAMGSVLFALAPWIGRHNHLTATETMVLRAMAPLYVISAFRVIPYIRLEREFQFARIARIEVTAAIVRHTTAIVLAFAIGGVWALVVSNIAGACLQLSLAYRASPGWVGVGFSWRTFRPLIAYGGQVQALAILGYFKDNVSRALLGAVLGPGAVGLFDFGLAYIQVPVTAVNALARVQLPVYARLGADDPTLFGALRGATRTALLLGIPMLLLLAFGAPWIVPTVYSARWIGSFPVVWGLLGNMAFGLLASPLFTLLQGQGRAGLAVLIFVGWTGATWGLAVGALVLWPGNIGAVAGAYSVVTAIVVVAMLRWSSRHLRRGLFASLQAPLVAGTLAAGAGVAMVRLVRTGVAAHPIVVALTVVVLYAVLVLLFEGRRVVAEVRAVVRPEPVRDTDPPTESGVTLPPTSATANDDDDTAESTAAR